MDILILNLVAFSQTGGVEKVSRILTKAGFDIAQETKKSVLNLSMYDEAGDDRYCPSTLYKGFGKRKLAFMIEALKHGRKAEHLLLTHVNLALPALLIKLINPSVKIHLIAHGIEVWTPLSKIQQWLLSRCHQILAVSTFTRNKIAERYLRTRSKIAVLNNCLDPFYVPASKFEKPKYLLKRYEIQDGEKIILTLCRLSSSEKYKGYDTVIKSLHDLKEKFPVKYLLLGKYDEQEFQRISEIIEIENLKDQVILAGFVKDEELADHFLLGDLFIMPSVKEGFGIVFIEAAASGMPVIAGNQDGSVDALLNGGLGPLIDPFSKDSIREAITEVLTNPPHPKTQQHLTINHFSYFVYKNKLKASLFFEQRLTVDESH